MRKIDELGLRFLETTVRNLRSEKGPAPSLLWHYTSGLGLLGILQSREIWSTHYTCLNDEAELNAGFKLAANLINLYEQKFQQKEHVQILLAQMKRLLLGEVLPELKQPPFGFPESFLGEHYECFVTSFSEENDDLAQWRAYGSGEGGYALGFEPEIVDHVSNTPPLGSVSLVPVLYHADEQHKLLFEFLNAVVDALEQDLEDQNAPYRGGREAVVLEHARDAVVMFSYIAPHI